MLQNLKKTKREDYSTNLFLISKMLLHICNLQENYRSNGFTEELKFHSSVFISAS